MNNKFNIGLIGLGTVGSGVVKTLRNFDFINIKQIAVKNLGKKRNIENLDEYPEHKSEHRTRKFKACP